MMSLGKEMMVCRTLVYLDQHTDRCVVEFAEYTSAKERIALGKKSRKLEAQKKKENMVELIEEA